MTRIDRLSWRFARSASALTVLFGGLAVACSTPRTAEAPATEGSARHPNRTAERRAILVSFDSFSERRMLESLPASSVPGIRALFSLGACAEYARPAFPSLTAPGHASLWTGAYGNVSGIAANSQPRLPWHAHTLIESISGYSSEALRAEPLWLTAVRSGVGVVGHHVTQAPGPPAYPAVTGEPDVDLVALREAAARDIQSPRLALVNGYNRRLAWDTLLTERQAPPRPAAGWRNLESLRSGVPPLEIAWLTGGDSLFGVLYGPLVYDRVAVAPVRDVARAVTAHAAAPDTTALGSRPLARFYSAPIPLRSDAGPGHLVVRLFALDRGGTRFELFMPEVNVVEGNRPEVAAEYLAATGGWTGNAAGRLLRRGGFGPSLANGGSGDAEARWLDAAEYLTQQSIRGAEWAWRRAGTRLLLDYFPLGDETDHMLYGALAPGVPSPSHLDVAAIARARTRAWELVDRRLAALQSLVAGDSAAVLVVSGDHGMRPTWRVFRPNVALESAGLLARGPGGRPDLGRTRALTPNGYFVSINTTAHRGGIVPPESAAVVQAAVSAALRATRGPDGDPVVTGVWTAGELDSLGAGGPAGGDVYFALAAGYRSSADMGGDAVSAGSVDAGHGFLSTEPDMHTVLCAYGDAAAPRRGGPARTIDAAPTVADWLGIRAPRDARGTSRLADLLGR